MMKKIYIFIIIFLLAIVLYIGCRKSETVIIQNDVDIAAENIPVEAVSTPILEQEETAQEEIEIYRDLAPEVREIIENYGNVAPELNHTYERALAFHIEGNFTNSGNREIVAFYERAIAGPLHEAFCFVLDTSEEKVEKIYQIGWYGTIEYGEETEAESGLTRDLGRFIVWKNWKIGCVSDFNGNGKEELYLYSRSGMHTQPYFFEFDETGFVQLLDIEGVYAFIDSVDIEKKIINIRIHGERYISDRIPSIRIIEKKSYIWDNETRRYLLLAVDTKEYRWNSDTWQYEEIVE